MIAPTTVHPITEYLIEVSKLEAAPQTFADEPDWQQFNTPKNHAMALTGEVGELVELLQWLTPEQSGAVATDPKTAQAARDKLADVLLYTGRLISVLEVDLNADVQAKLTRRPKHRINHADFEEAQVR